jgi:hypothetical protein
MTPPEKTAHNLKLDQAHIQINLNERMRFEYAALILAVFSAMWVVEGRLNGPAVTRLL